MPKVLQRGVVLPHYPNKTFLGGVERPMSGSSLPTRDEPATLPPHTTGEGAPQFATLGATTPTALPLAKAGGEEETCLDKMKMPVKSRKRGAELRQSQSDSEDEGSMDENHIPTVADSDHPDSDVQLDRDDLEVASIIDPTYVNDINSELQDQGIGVAGDVVMCLVHRYKS
jgi:hypothetical protein